MVDVFESGEEEWHPTTPAHYEQTTTEEAGAHSYFTLDRGLLSDAAELASG